MPFLARHSKQLLLLLALSLPIALIFTQLYLQSQNTLASKPAWESSKTGLKIPVNAAVAFYITPVTLDKNRLNMGAWFGFQEVLLKEALAPAEIEFDLSLPEGSYLNFIYNKDEAGFSGLRLSRSSAFPSMHFTASAQGKFLQKDRIELTIAKESNRLRAVWEKDEIHFFLNGQSIASFPENFLARQRLGFRGGVAPVSIDNISIRSKDSTRLFQENFDPGSEFWREFLKIFGLVLLFDAVILLCYKVKLGTKASKDLFNYAYSFNVLILLIGIPLYFANLSYLSNTYLFSKLYFKFLALDQSYRTHIETRDEAVARLRQEYSKGSETGPIRILFLGSSQTWGAGASEAEHSFIRRLETKWKSDAQSPLQCINAGISGEKSAGMWELYSQEWFQWQPRVVVLNLSNNDIDSARFAENLQKFAEFNRSQGIATVFSLEANAPEAPRPSTLQNHKVMAQVAQEYGIPVVDLHGCLAEKADSGFLWWDFVHLTSYGHELAAECLEGGLAKTVGIPVSAVIPTSANVTPAKAGVHLPSLDPRLREDDK